MPKKRSCRLCRIRFGQGIMMVKVKDFWLCSGCFVKLVRERYKS